LQSVCPLATTILPTPSPTESSLPPTISPTRSNSEKPSLIPTLSPSALPTPLCPPVRRNGTTLSPQGGINGRSLFVHKQRRIGQHQFYTPLQDDARGRSVGSRNPVLPPSECPEVDMSLLEEKKTNSPVETPLGPKLTKKMKSKVEYKEPIDDIKGGDTKTMAILPVSKKMSKAKNTMYDDNNDDDVSFIILQRTPTPSQAPSVTPTQTISARDNNPLGIQQSNVQRTASPTSMAPTRTHQQLETLYKQYHHVAPMMAKGKMDNRTRRRR
jgi:hypothetical protein